MTEKPWKKDVEELTVEINKLAAQANAMNYAERINGADALRKGLKSEGVDLSLADEEVIKHFEEGRYSFEELSQHFYGRLPAPKSP